MKLFPVQIKRTTILQGEGAPGGFTDAFRLGITFPDSNAVLTDAMAIALAFPDALAAQNDLLKLGLLGIGDLNAEQLDAFRLAIAGLGDTNAAPSDAATYAMALTLADSVAAQSELLKLGFPTGNFADSNPAPTEGRAFTMRAWLSASAGTGVTSPANADGQNDGVVATLTTAVAQDPTEETLTSSLGVNVPNGITVTNAIYRGWFKSVNVLSTSAGTLTMVSIGTLFANKIMFTSASTNTTVDHLAGTFTYDLFANGVNTLALLQSCQMKHKADDAAGGISPHILTVDAGCIEITGAFS